MENEENNEVLLLTQSMPSLRYLEYMTDIWKNELTLSVTDTCLNCFNFSCITLSWSKNRESSLCNSTEIMET